LNRDTDGDGGADGDEVRLGTDPKNPSSHLPLNAAALFAEAALLAILGAASARARAKAGDAK
jgi:hypothetical protein